jgi:acyl carrier protein
MDDRKPQVCRRVIELAAAQVDADPAGVTPATHFVNDLSYDSLEVVEFTMKVEDEFELSVPDEAAEKLDTVGKVVDYVVAHTDEREGG